MSDEDHAEEQEMEAEALSAIFEDHFKRTGSVWKIELYPNIAHEEVNHVGCQVIVTLPPDYPAVLPQLSVQVLKGLASAEHGHLLQSLAVAEAQANEGVPSIFAVCERLREWLVENNVKGLDDQSMHAQMLRKQQQQSRQSEVRVACSVFALRYGTISVGTQLTIRGHVVYLWWSLFELVREKFDRSRSGWLCICCRRGCRQGNFVAASIGRIG